MHSTRHQLSGSRGWASAAALAFAPFGLLGAQLATPRDSVGRPAFRALVGIGGATEDRLRTAQLIGGTLDGHQFRSVSSMTPTLRGGSRGLQVSVVLPHVRTTYNSRLPYSWNDEAMWAGRGNNVDVVAGAIIDVPRLRLIIAPELASSQNRPYALPADTTISPPVPTSRNPFSSPWHAGSQSIDLPIRFGESAFTRVQAGQSSLTYDAGRIAIGAATESQWWGPGLRNALLLSNNAGGFPHLFARTGHPLATPIGTMEGRWLAGGLSESPFFDADPTNDLRSIAVLGISLRPRGSANLVLGATRVVFAATSGWGSALTSFPQVFRDVGQPNAVPAADSTHPRGHDALLSLFARWRAPESGLELYAEWARAEMPTSPRDFLVQPTHSQGYTLGLGWLSSVITTTRGHVRVQAEATYVEQSTTFRFREIGSWYTSHTVEQGYTQRGQNLGAALGPGASSQWLAVDHILPGWQAGAYLSRARVLQDVRSQRAFTGDSAYCGQDVSLLPGIRGRAVTRQGTFGIDYSSGWRLNVFLDQVRGNCFEVQTRDVRNRSLTLTFTPTFP